MKVRIATPRRLDGDRARLNSTLEPPLSSSQVRKRRGYFLIPANLPVGWIDMKVWFLLCPSRSTLEQLENRGSDDTGRSYILTMKFAVAVTHEAPWYVARCLDVDVVSQGETVDEAVANLEEALGLYFEGEDLSDSIERPVITTVLIPA